LPFKSKKRAQEYFTEYNHKRAERVKKAMALLEAQEEKERQKI
jgi:hypothetical protein